MVKRPLRINYSITINPTVVFQIGIHSLRQSWRMGHLRKKMVTSDLGKEVMRQLIANNSSVGINPTALDITLTIGLSAEIENKITIKK